VAPAARWWAGSPVKSGTFRGALSTTHSLFSPRLSSCGRADAAASTLCSTGSRGRSLLPETPRPRQRPPLWQCERRFGEAAGLRSYRFTPKRLMHTPDVQLPTLVAPGSSMAMLMPPPVLLPTFVLLAPTIA
jgi:hypothetical protein